MNGQTPETVSFLSENASAIFALAGALGAAVISLVAAFVLRRQDHSLRLWEKIADRRIHAHERILESAMEMRVMTALGGADEEGEPLRTPNAMLSKGHFEGFFERFTSASVSGSTWQTADVKREVNFVQDYVVTLYQTLVDVPTDLYPNVGTIIREDFIDLSASLEKKVQGFFQRDLMKLKVGSFDDWHKYPQEETIRRLLETELMRNQKAIYERSHPAMLEPLIQEDDQP